MSVRWIAVVLIACVAALAYFAWNGSKPAQQAQAPMGGEVAAPAMPGAGEVSVPVGEDPGVEWTVPAAWTVQPERPMRFATYTVPGAGGAEGAECAVYYFGPGQGGGTDANIERWIGEFQKPDPPERTSRPVGDLTVSRVRVKGTYMAHAMGGMGTPAPEGGRPDYELLAAIVEGPAGSVFFKLTGPKQTVDAAVKAFDGMLASVKKKG